MTVPRRDRPPARGYADGLAGRPAVSLDARYQEGWRRGRADRARLQARFQEAMR